MDIFLFVFIMWNFLGFMIGLCLNEWYEINPKEIWRQYNSINIFGCIVLTIILNLLCPVVSLFYWFYKLCTVGRRQDNV